MYRFIFLIQTITIMTHSKKTQHSSDLNNHSNQNNEQESFPALWVMMLGVMIAIGPLSIDMYLPALPSMAEDFGVTTTNIARSVPAYFIGLVVGQLFYGPFSDRVGRVLPMYIGMVIFVLASIVCATITNEIVLFAARTVQAFGACVTAVVTRAAIRDRLSPIGSARAFSLMVLVMGLAPILAPSLGALVLKIGNWQMIFWVLAGYGVLNLILTKLFLKETLPAHQRVREPMSHAFAGYADLLKDTRFLLPAVAGGLLQGAFFIYLTIASELFMQEFGLSESAFAIAFGANAFGFILLTQVNQFLTKKYHLIKLFRFGAIMQLIFATCLMVLGLSMGSDAPFVLVFLFIFCCIAFLGFTQPNAAAIALAYQKHRAGMASAAQGALQFSVGIFGGLLLSLVAASPLIKLGIIVFVLVLIGTVLVYRINPKLDLTKLS